MYETSKVKDIKVELRSITDYYPARPKDEMIDAYAIALQDYSITQIKESLRVLANNAGRFYPTLQEIKAIIGKPALREQALEKLSCQWCDSTGRIFAKEKATGMEYGFRCQCELGSELASIIPRWSSSKFGENYTRIK